MRVLILRDQHDFAARLRNQLATRVEHVMLIPVAWEAVGETIDLQRLIEQQKPDFIVSAVFLPFSADHQQIRQFRQVIEQLERCARKNSLPLIFFSSGAVFDGSKLAYTEDEAVCPDSDYGTLYAELESQIARKLRRHLIIRSTWLYCSQGDNFLTSVVEYAAAQKPIRVNSAAKSCPTALNDLSRVLLAILFQLELGADNWGIYHYASSDTALGFQFIEAILAQASQFNADIDARQLRFEHHEEPDALFYFEPVILKCHKLLENFGIHQRPWRSVLPDTVRELYSKSETVTEQLHES